MSTKVPLIAIACVLSVAVACSRSSPIVPSDTAFGGFAAGPGGATLKIDAPRPISPTHNFAFEPGDATVTLSWANVSGRYASFPVSYELELRNSAGDLIAHPVNLAASSGEMTSWTIAPELAEDLVHGWRIRATYNGAWGPWSDIFQFRSAPPPPRPVGCSTQGSPLRILACNRAKYPTPMGHMDLYLFLLESARDFNTAGVPGGPWGLLRKASGNNCNGYSCDILCAGQGSDQEQYDVLVDENIPTFGGSLGSGIRVDVCEIQ